MTTEEKLRAARAEYMKTVGESFDRLLAKGESPIEQLMLAALINHGWAPGGSMHDYFRIREAVQRFHPGLDPGSHYLLRDDSEHACLIQPTISARGAKARVDLAFVTMYEQPSGLPRVAIELDGHDFHERTKEQASRDKGRDRRLTLSGWAVLHFTGSDVYARADEIADDLFWEIAGKGESRE